MISPKRLLGAITATCGLLYFLWHLLQGGVPPHALWVVIGAIAVLVGIWLVLSPTDRRDIRLSGKEKKQ